MHAPGPRCTFFPPFSVLVSGISLFFTFISPPKCMRQGRMVVVWIKEAGQPTIYIQYKSDGCASSVVLVLIIYSYIHRFKKGGDDSRYSTLSSLRK